MFSSYKLWNRWVCETETTVWPAEAVEFHVSICPAGKRRRMRMTRNRCCTRIGPNETKCLRIILFDQHDTMQLWRGSLNWYQLWSGVEEISLIVVQSFLAMTKLAFNDTSGSWNTVFLLLLVVISMRSGKTTLRGWHRKSLKPRIGSIGYFVCLFNLSHLFDIRFSWTFAKICWTSPQSHGHASYVRHSSSRQGVQ